MHKKDAIEKLKEHNKTLKAERKNLNDIIDHLRFRVADLTAASQELRKTVAQKEEELEWQSLEIDGLKWDNDRLQKEIIGLIEKIENSK